MDADQIRRAAQLAASVRRRAGEGFIYAAEIVGYDDVVKIGHSLQPHRRVKHIKVLRGPYLRARLLAFTPGTFGEEHILQGKLAAHRHPARLGNEFYPRSILSHEAIPDGLRVVA